MTKATRLDADSGDLDAPSALRRRAECLRQSADNCEDGASRACLLDTAQDLEAEATFLEDEEIEFR